MPRYFLCSRVLVYSFSNMNLCIFMHFFYLILLELIIFFLNQMLAWHADVVFLLLFY